MATLDSVRRIVLGLDGVSEDADSRFRVAGKLLCWPWLERVDPRRARVPNRDVLVVRVASEDEKHALIALDDAAFFTEPHYDGYAAVLVRLAAVDPALLERVLTNAWRVVSAPSRRRHR
ncbi:MAG TPA: hypothetical protein VGK63_02365 [Candidatus Limnocylindrales bacterium]